MMLNIRVLPFKTSSLKVAFQGLSHWEMPQHERR